ENEEASMLQEAATVKDVHHREEAEEENRFEDLDGPAGMAVSEVPSQEGVGGSPEAAMLRHAAQAADRHQEAAAAGERVTRVVGDPGRPLDDRRAQEAEEEPSQNRLRRHDLHPGEFFDGSAGEEG